MKHASEIACEFATIMNKAAQDSIEAVYYHSAGMLPTDDLKEILRLITSKMNAELGDIIREYQKNGGCWSHIC
jgi:hypothetical protein